MKHIFPYLNVLRPLNLIFSALAVIITAYITNSLVETTAIINTIIVVITFAGASNILNDIFDINIDKKNQPHRPLPSGRISFWGAMAYMLTLYFLGIYMAFALTPLATKIALLLVLPTLVLYTPFYKRIPLAGNIVVAGVLGMVFIFSEVSFTGGIKNMWVPAWLAFGLTLIRELIKDIEDIHGDRLDGAKTLPVLLGVKKSLYLAYLLIFIFCILWWIPYFDGFYSNAYAICLFFAVEIPLILSIFFLWKNPTSSGCAIISRATKWITLGGMVTILCSSL